MGKNCYHSIGKPLPKRSNIILTKDPYFIVSNCIIAHSIPEALEIAYENGEEEAFIIGGAKVYEQTSKLWDRLFLTQVDLEIEGDVYFPEINYSEWNLLSEEKHLKDEKNPHDYTFLNYERAVK